ncbi:hypothetical protein B0O99DRAFT_733115 [Bisporella sp. PMI_857]|nr:hypothetical protein B0O99DRAFT_733115 [Bisporella sp. PMI_857]
MTGGESDEEKKEERDFKYACAKNEVEFKVWVDKKHLVDDCDPQFRGHQQLLDVFTTYRKSIEPLRNKPRSFLSTSKAKFPPNIPHRNTTNNTPYSVSPIPYPPSSPRFSNPSLARP